MKTVFTNEHVEREIEAGANVCKRLKQLFYFDKPWVDSRADVLALFNEAKKRLRKHYPADSSLILCEKMNSYRDEDLKRLLVKHEQ